MARFASRRGGGEVTIASEHKGSMTEAFDLLLWLRKIQQATNPPQFPSHQADTNGTYSQTASTSVSNRSIDSPPNLSRDPIAPPSPVQL